MGILIGLILWCGVCGAISMALAHESKKGLGFILGAVFGPFGVLIAAIALKNP